MKFPKKLPVIHTAFVVAFLISIAFLISLVTFNFVVLKKVDEVEAVVENLLGTKFVAAIKQDFVKKIIKIFKENRQLMATTQTLASLIIVMLGVRLFVLFSLLFPPKKGSMLSVFRRPYEELESLLEDGGDKVQSGTSEESKN